MQTLPKLGQHQCQCGCLISPDPGSRHHMCERSWDSYVAVEAQWKEAEAVLVAYVLLHQVWEICPTYDRRDGVDGG